MFYSLKHGSNLQDVRLRFLGHKNEVDRAVPFQHNGLLFKPKACTRVLCCGRWHKIDTSQMPKSDV